MVSIVIPAYNRADLLDETLASIKKQRKIDYEIIVIDDNSENNEIYNTCLKYNVRYYKNEENSGAQVSRNKGVELSKYDYIAFMDSDDKWETDTKLYDQYNILKDTLNISVVFTSLKYMDINSKISNTVSLSFTNEQLNKNFSKIILDKDIIGTYSSVMIRKSDFIKCGKCDIHLPARQDWELWIRLSEIGNAYCLFDNYTLYRVHDNQISSDAKRKLDGYSFLLESHKSYFYDKNQFLSFNMHLLRVILLKIFLNENSNFYDKLKASNTIKFKFYKSFILLILKMPCLKKMLIKKIRNTYLFKGLFR